MLKVLVVALVLHEASCLKFNLSANNSLGPSTQAKARTLPDLYEGGALHGVLGM